MKARKLIIDKFDHRPLMKIQNSNGKRIERNEIGKLRKKDVFRLLLSITIPVSKGGIG